MVACPLKKRGFERKHTVARGRREIRLDGRLNALGVAHGGRAYEIRERRTVGLLGRGVEQRDAVQRTIDELHVGECAVGAARLRRCAARQLEIRRQRAGRRQMITDIFVNRHDFLPLAIGDDAHGLVPKVFALRVGVEDLMVGFAALVEDADERPLDGLDGDAVADLLLTERVAREVHTGRDLLLSV